MQNKSFSFMLAWRYLNPRRAWVSSITMISVLGVLLGVLVLVVVMAVYAGLEKEQKSRLLGFSPHILLQPQTLDPEEINRGIEVLKKTPGVISVNTHVEDYVVVDSNNLQKPTFYQSLDTSNAELMKGIALDDHYPGSTTDLGTDERVLVSSTIAEDFNWQVHDKILLYSTRNFQQVMGAYKKTDQDVLSKRFPKEISDASKLITQDWKETADGFTINRAQANVFNALYPIYEKEDVRNAEHDTIEKILSVYESASKDEATDTFHFPQGSHKELLESITALTNADQAKLDADLLRSLKSIVLPKEVEIMGVYKSDRMSNAPSIFMPLPLAQTIANTKDAPPEIAIRVENPYEIETYRSTISPLLGGLWHMRTWSEQHGLLFRLLSQQRVMMYFVLSFIMIISAFSMMAVMFTITIQKKREIGVMKALGASPAQILRVFLWQGAILGFVGSALGVLLGKIVIAYRDELQILLRKVGFDPFSGSFVGFDTLPAFQNPQEQFLIALMGFILCIFASLIPAFFASRSDAAKSLRNL